MGADTDLARSGDVDHILDAGAPGLQYFEHYLPMLDEATSTCGTTYQDVCAKYDAQRNMRLAALSIVADGMKKVLAAADTEWETQNAHVRTLPSVWQGEAATAATEMMRGLVTRSNEDRIAARNALGAIETAIPALKLIIAGKANAVRALWDRTDGKIDGKTPSQIYDIVQGAKNSGMGANPFDRDQRIDHLKAMFPGIDEDDIPNKCSEWLKGPFQQDVKDKLDIFERACANCHTGVEGLYKVITDALAQVNDAPYPKAEAQKKYTPPPGPNPSPDPASATTSQPGTTPKSPTSATPSATPISSNHDDLAQLTQLTGQVSPLLDSASKTLSQADSALSAAIQQAVDQAAETGSVLSGLAHQTADAAKQSIPQLTDGIHAELDLAGNRLRLDADPTGELNLTTSRAGGEATTYTLRLDEHGIPVISESKPGEAEHDSSDDDRSRRSDSSEADRDSRSSGTRAGGEEDMSPAPEDGDETRIPGHHGRPVPGDDSGWFPGDRDGRQTPDGQDGPQVSNDGNEAHTNDRTRPPAKGDVAPPPRHEDEPDHRPRITQPEPPSGTGPDLAEAGPL